MRKTDLSGQPTSRGFDLGNRLTFEPYGFDGVDSFFNWELILESSKMFKLSVFALLNVFRDANLLPTSQAWRIGFAGAGRIFLTVRLGLSLNHRIDSVAKVSNVAAKKDYAGDLQALLRWRQQLMLWRTSIRSFDFYA